jgi:hypothetical protein
MKRKAIEQAQAIDHKKDDAVVAHGRIRLGVACSLMKANPQSVLSSM